MASCLAARDSAHTIDLRGGSPTRAYAPECPPAAPRPRANRLLGFALELRRNQLRTYERAMREDGDVVRLVVGPPGLRFELTCVFRPADPRPYRLGPLFAAPGADHL
jgi:hypothetical protein